MLDEFTSNLDSLNEGIIPKSLKESAKNKTVVFVSHRTSTMNVADVVYEIICDIYGTDLPFLLQQQEDRFQIILKGFIRTLIHRKISF